MRQLALLVVLACGAPPKAASLRALAGDVVIHDVTLVPMDRDTTIAHQSVIIRGDKIVAIAAADTVEIPAGATRIDGAGKWLMPGLADMHVHATAEADLTMLVAAGVTTARIMWGREQHLAWRELIASGKQLGPALVVGSAIIDGDPPTLPGFVVLTKPEDADALVADFKAKGYDFLKPYSRLDAAVYAAVAAAAKKHGLTLQGHVPSAVTLDAALAAGQKSIEHLDGWFLALAPGEERKPRESQPAMLRRLLPKLDASRIAVIAEQMKQAGTYNCATLIVSSRLAALDDVAAVERQLKWLSFIAPDVRARWDPKADFRLSRATPEDFATMRESNAVRANIVRVLASSNAPLLVGTDTGNPYVIAGESMHEELELLVAAGLSRPRVMRAATADAGTFLGASPKVGVVAVGARADLLLVSVDPMTTPLPLVPDGVVLRGRWLPKPELEVKLAAIATPTP